MSEKIDLDIAFANALLSNLPNSLYNPAIFVDKNNNIIDKILNEFVIEVGEKGFVVIEIKKLADMRDFEKVIGSYSNKSFVLIIRNIHRYEADTAFREMFVKIYNYAKENQIQMIITTDRNIKDLRFDGRVYARLMSGVVAKITSV